MRVVVEGREPTYSQTEIDGGHDLARGVEPLEVAQHQALLVLAHEAEVLLLQLPSSRLPCSPQLLLRTVNRDHNTARRLSSALGEWKPAKAGMEHLSPLVCLRGPSSVWRYW